MFKFNLYLSQLLAISNNFFSMTVGLFGLQVLLHSYIFVLLKSTLLVYSMHFLPSP